MTCVFPDAMSTTFCVEEANDHEYLRKFLLSKVSRLKGNAQKGCQVCGLLYHAIEAFYGQKLLEEHRDSLQFLHTGKIFDTFSVVLDKNPSLHGFDLTNHAEIVYEIPKLSLQSGSTKALNYGRLDGVNSAMGILWGRRIPALPNIDLLRYWIQQCIENHEQCETEPHSILPKRVLDVGSSWGEHLRFHESKGQKDAYIALSHRWREAQLLTTTTSTLNAQKQSIDWSDLSRTFQDAIALTRLLGIRYLWIDSLCIIQDDSLDWEVESAQMADIYEKSYVTISANTTNGALLNVATRTNRSLQIGVVDVKGATCPICIRPIISHEMFFASSMETYGSPGKDLDPGYPLFKRAWCFQERLLATRILHFADEEVTFECKTLCDCECGGNLHSGKTHLKSYFRSISKQTPNTFSVPSGDTAWEEWTRIVNQYVRKDITYPTDILPALAGIATRMKCEELGSYVAGLWETQLPRGLFWFAPGFSACKATAITTAPSFSWASLAGTSKVNEVAWPDTSSSSYATSRRLFQVLDVKCDVSTHNPFGMVSEASILLSGHLLPIQLRGERGMRGRNSIMRSSALESHVAAFMDRTIIADMVVETNLTCFFGFSTVQDDFKGGKIATVSLLLLEGVRENVYRRVGCVPRFDEEEIWLNHAREMTFSPAQHTAQAQTIYILLLTKRIPSLRGANFAYLSLCTSQHELHEALQEASYPASPFTRTWKNTPLILS